jgi:hypothetical protein
MALVALVCDRPSSALRLGVSFFALTLGLPAPLGDSKTRCFASTIGVSIHFSSQANIYRMRHVVENTRRLAHFLFGTASP